MLTETTLHEMAVHVSNMANSTDQILDKNGHDWEIQEIHLANKARSGDKVKCTYKLINGKMILVCEMG